MFRTTKRHAFVLGGATIALVLALGGIYNSLIPYLLFLGTVIPPVGGAIVADFWLRHRGQFPNLETPLPRFNWAGVIAYVLACGIAYLSSRASLGVAPINGVIAAAVLYFILIKVLPQSTYTRVAK